MSNETAPDYSNCTDEELLTLLRRAKVKGVSDQWKRPALERNCAKHGLVKVEPSTTWESHESTPEEDRAKLKERINRDGTISPRPSEEKQPPPPQKVYSHPSRLRCEKIVPSRSHPAFLGVKGKCGGIMHPERIVQGTGGQRKRYQCQDCGARRDVNGVEV